MTLAFNPSHLEFVNPVVEGRVRAKQDRKGDDEARITRPAAADPRGCCLRRPRRRRRDAQPEPTPRPTKRAGRFTSSSTTRSASRRIPEDSRSTAYCTDITRMLALPGVPRKWRRPGGRRTSGHAGYRIPTVVPRRRRSRPLLLPQVRPQRRRRAPVHATSEMYAAIDRKKRTVREVYVEHLKSRPARSPTSKPKRSKSPVANKTSKTPSKTPATNGNYNLIPASMLGHWTDYQGGSRHSSVRDDADTKVPRETSLVDDSRSGLRPIRTGSHRTPVSNGSSSISSGRSWKPAKAWTGGPRENLAFGSLARRGAFDAASPGRMCAEGHSVIDTR